MDLDNYRNFLAVVENGSITGASEFVHIAQPALSKQLKMLENFMGAKLILTERGSRRIVLTEAGRILYQKAKYICSLEDLAKEEILETRKGAAGILRFSVSNSRSAPLIHRILKKFSALYPGVSFEIHETGFYEQSQQLLNGITEIGVLSTPVQSEDDFDELFRRYEYLAVIFNKNSKWLKHPERKGMQLADLHKIPLCISTGCHEMLKQSCNDVGFVPFILSINTSRYTTLQWAMADAGVAIAPIEAGENLGEEFRVKKLLDVQADLYKSVVKVRNRPLSPLAFKFLQFYQENSDSQCLCDMRKLEQESKI